MKGKTNFRLLRSKRIAALVRPELRKGPRPAPLSAEQIAQAVADGKFQRIEAKR